MSKSGEWWQLLIFALIWWVFSSWGKKKKKSSPPPLEQSPAAPARIKPPARPVNHFRASPISEEPSTAPSVPSNPRRRASLKKEWIVHYEILRRPYLD